MRFLLTLIISTLLVTGSIAQATEYSFEISWQIENEEGVEVAGYRLYDLQDNLVCETPAPAESMVCTADIPGTEATYTLVSYSTQGVESDPSDPFTIIFEEPPPLEAVFTFATTENSLSVDFDATGSTGSISQYSWNFNDGSPLDYTVTPSHTFSAAGTYNVALTVQDENGATQSITHAVTVSQTSDDNQAPIVYLSVSPGNGTSPLSVNFDAGDSSDPEGADLTYTWDFGDGTTDTTSGAQAEHTYIVSSPGTITFTASVTVSDGQLDSLATMTVMVTNDDSGGTGTTTATAVITTGTLGPAPITVSFYGTGSSPSEGATISEYNWDFGDGSTGSGAEVQHAYTVDGSYNVTLTVIDSDGVQAQTMTSIDIGPETPARDNITPTLIQIYKLLLLNK